MNNPSVLTLFIIFFLLLGFYNIFFVGARRLREARARNQPTVWYKQINILTGIEYVLLAMVFLLSLYSRNGTLSPSLISIITPVYFVLLIAAAILAGLVIRQSITNARRQRSTPPKQNTQAGSLNGTVIESTQRSASIQRKRERRRNAAAARRRRGGKA